MREKPVGPTSAYIDIVVQNNATFSDAFQFDPPPNGFTGTTGVTGPQWSFSGQNFRLDIKGNKGQTGPLLSIWGPTGGSNMIIVDDVAQRTLHFNVPDVVVTGAVTGTTGATGPGLIPGQYQYDFIMYDGSTPPIRIPLMHGTFTVRDGITGN